MIGRLLNSYALNDIDWEPLAGDLVSEAYPTQEDTITKAKSLIAAINLHLLELYIEELVTNNRTELISSNVDAQNSLVFSIYIDEDGGFRIRFNILSFENALNLPNGTLAKLKPITLSAKDIRSAFYELISAEKLQQNNDVILPLEEEKKTQDISHAGSTTPSAPTFFNSSVDAAPSVSTSRASPPI